MANNLMNEPLRDQNGLSLLKGTAESPYVSGPSDGLDLLAAIWRYRWAALLPTILGVLIALVVFLKTPETYKSSTRLMFESDRPVVLDGLTGDIVGGVPSIDIIHSELLSDEIIRKAFQSEHLRPFYEFFDSQVAAYNGVSSKCLDFEHDMEDIRNATVLVAALSYSHTNQELCEASVKAFSESLQDYYTEKHESVRGELLRYISDATDNLQPRMEKLEDEYRKFRTSVPLVWNDEGVALNPHRERQLALTARRSEMFEDLRQKSIELSTLEQIAEETKDPRISLSIVGQLLGKSFEAGSESDSNSLVRDSDAELAQLEIDQQLVPLIIERNKFAAEFGDSHPTVKQLDSELTIMKRELKRLVTEQTNRLVELMQENKVDAVDPVSRATQAMEVILIASGTEVALLQKQIDELDIQIEQEKLLAMDLAKYEEEDASFLREMDRNQELMNQLQERMAAVSLTEEEGGLRVTELVAPSAAFRVGPSLPKTIGIGLIGGLFLGCCLAVLLERNANTFRDPEEIVAAVGAPILTHMPHFKGKVRKGRPDNPNPFEKLDPYLAVVHQPSSIPAEAVRSCRTSIFFELASIQSGKVIQVTSPLPGDGKSTIAENLAASIAQSGKKTLLIDADLRRPQVTDNFAMQDRFGLIDILMGKRSSDEVVHDTPLATLKVMPSGPIPANPAEALTMPEMSELVECLRKEYDYVVIDSPPLLVVTDPSIVAGMVDGVVMALKIRRKSKPNAKEAAGILRNVGSRILGVVVNNSDEASRSDGYKGYGYYRYGRYTSRYYRKTPELGESSGKRRSPVVVSGRSTRHLSLKPSETNGQRKADSMTSNQHSSDA